MKVESMDGHSCNTQRIAIVGMPRSGSTIVASYINSLNGAMIVGEPYLQSIRPRPIGKEWPTIVPTRYGTLHIPYGEPYGVGVWDSIQKFGVEKCIQIIGFKECMTPTINIASIVEGLLPSLDLVLVVIREPRKNYMSMKQMTPEGHIPLSVEEFNKWYISLIELASLRCHKIQPVNLDFFRINPQLEIQDATGWDLSGPHVFKQYSGGGDTNARVSQAVSPVDQRTPYPLDDILPSVEEYERVYVPFMLEKIVNSERIVP